MWMEWGGMEVVGDKLMEVMRGDQAIARILSLGWNGELLWGIF